MATLDPTIKPINTLYAGRHFRSRLEARWAVFFDNISWEWQYEAEGYKLPSGNYLPDFFFPDFTAFAEVKPLDPTPEELIKCFELSELFIETPILLLIGPPSYSHVRTIINGGFGDNYVLQPFGSKFYPFFYETIDDSGTGIKHFKDFHDFVASAVNVANESRFEFEHYNKMF